MMGDREKDENAIEFDFHYCAVKLYVEIIKYCCRISEKNTQLLFLFEKSSFFSASNCQGELPFCFLSFSYFLVVKKLFPPSYLRWSPEAFPFFLFCLTIQGKNVLFFFSVGRGWHIDVRVTRVSPPYFSLCHEPLYGFSRSSSIWCALLELF